MWIYRVGKNVKNISHIQNFRGKKSRKKIRYAWHLCLPLQIHSTLCQNRLTYWNPLSNVLCPLLPSGEAHGNCEERHEKGQGSLTPFLWSHLSLAAPFEKRALLHLKWPILHNSFWFYKPLWPHSTFIFREGNFLVGRFWDCALTFVVFWESSHFFLTHHFINKPSLNDRNLSVLSLFCCLIQQLIPVVSWETSPQNGIMTFKCS